MVAFGPGQRAIIAPTHDTDNSATEPKSCAALQDTEEMSLEVRRTTTANYHPRRPCPITQTIPPTLNGQASDDPESTSRTPTCWMSIGGAQYDMRDKAAGTVSPIRAAHHSHGRHRSTREAYHLALLATSMSLAIAISTTVIASGQLRSE